MSTDLWVALGAITTFAGLYIVKRLEHSWVAPASLFFVAYFSHAYISPAVQVGIISTYNPDTLLDAFYWSFVSQIALLAGYGLVAFKLAPSPVAVLRPLYSGVGAAIAALALGACLSLYLADMFLSSKFSLGRGAFAYVVDDSLLGRAAFASELLILPLCLSLFLSAPFLTGTNRAVATVAITAAITCVVGVALATFARFQAAFLLLMLVTTWHWRFRRISAGVALASGFLIVCIALFAELRNLAVGIAGLTTQEFIAELLFVLGEKLNPLNVLALLGTAIAGQEVFTQVLDLVPRIEPHRLGSTYLDSLLGVFAPRILFGYESIDTPAFWFKAIYAPNALGQGFDFSMLSEAYLNFGAMMWVVSLFIGLVLAFVSSRIRTCGSALAVMWAMLVLFAMIRGLRTDSSGMFKSFVYPMIPILAILLLEKLVRFAALPTAARLETRSLQGPRS